MNGYDFDKTIYEDDSTVDFYFYCIKRYKKTLVELPFTAVAGLAFFVRLLPKKTFKQIFFRFLRHIPDTEAAVEEFWKVHSYKIKDCYLKRKRTDDIIISASPEFLLAPVCTHATLIGSRVHPRTGKFTGENCFGQEKVNRLFAQFPGCTFEEFYSDSLSDAPLAALAQNAYLVTGNDCRPWPEDHR